MNRHQQYDKYKRNREAKRFYNAKAWEVCRTNVLIRDYYLCQSCLQNRLITAYDVVHHIKPLQAYPKLALVEENLICLCHSCHNKTENEKEIKNKKINVIEIKSNPEIV